MFETGRENFVVPGGDMLENSLGRSPTPDQRGTQDLAGSTGLEPLSPALPAAHKGGKMAEGLWLRLWVAAVRSRKIQTLSDNLFRWWVNLLCLSKAGNGKLPPFADIAWDLRTSEEKVSKAVSILVDRKLIDQSENGFRMHDWTEWQFSSDSSTERARASKQRSRERRGNVAGTLGQRPQRQSTETEYRAETESDLSLSFLAIHDAYPEHRRDKSHLTQSAFVQIMAPLHDDDRPILHAKILDGIRRAKASDDWKRNNGQYVPRLQKFLEEMHWTREYRSAAPKESDADRWLRLAEERDRAEGRA